MSEETKHFVSNPSGSKDLHVAIPKIKQQNINSTVINETERLNAISSEPIDLRDLFPNQCQPFRLDGITHYFDPPAELFFNSQVKRNKGHYTQAVFEAVQKHAAARLASGTYGEESVDEEASTFKPPSVIEVGYSQHRQENRLNFATDVEVELPSGSVIQARSVDISPSGVQLKLQSILDVIVGMELELSFPQLELKYEKQFGTITYRLMKSDIGSMFMTLKLARVDPGEHPFDLFLEDFIDSKKHRYRIDAEDSKLALTAKAWEYLYIKSLPYLACFVATRGEKVQIQELAISNQNKKQLSGLGNSMLSMLEQQMGSFRLNSIVTHDSSPPEIYAYRYQGTGLRRRIGATSWQFNNNQLRLEFLKAGVNEPTFAAWRIKVVKLDPMSEQRSKELIEKLSISNPEQSDSLIEQLSQYEYLIYLLDITENIKQDPLISHDENDEPIKDNYFDDYEIKLKRSADYTRLRLGISKRRNEERFLYQSPLVINYYGEKIKGQTVNLSVNGLKVAVNGKYSFQIRDTVTIDFVGFNKKFRSSKLKGQSYRIAAITPDGSLCLTRDHRITRHAAAMFMSKLLTKNKDILPTCTGELWMSTKSRLMESWLNLCLPTQSLLMTREEGKYDIPYILKGNFTDHLLAPFKIGKDIYNLEQLLHLNMLNKKIRELNVNSDHPLSIEIYLSQTGEFNNNVPIIELKIWSDFKDDLERVEYIKKCIKRSVYRFYTLSLSKVPRLDRSDLTDDMNVIRRNARHRLLDFEKEYQSLAVILELSDSSQEILSRYNLLK